MFPEASSSMVLTPFSASGVSIASLKNNEFVADALVEPINNPTRMRRTKTLRNRTPLSMLPTHSTIT